MARVMRHVVIVLIALALYLRTLAVNVEFTEPSQDVVAADGQPFWWHCRAHVTDSSVNDITYWWQHNDAKVENTSNSVTYSNGTLVLSNVSQQSVGQYQCTASIRGENYYSKVVTLSLAFTDSKFTESPASHNTSVGLSIALVCEILSIPPAEVTWLFNGNKAKIGKVVQTARYKITLLIEELSYYEGGEYRCQAVNSVSREVRFSDVAVIEVRGAPHFLSVSEPITSAPGSTVYLHCLALGNPIPKVMWSREPSLPQGTDVYNNSMIRISNMQQSYSGFYTCRATNSLGSVQRTVLVICSEDYVAADFSQHPTSVTIVSGQTATVTCIAVGVPSPDVTWRNPYGAAINSTYIPYVGALLLTPEIAVSGNWTAEARNTVGETQAKFSVTIYEKARITTSSHHLVAAEKESLQLQCNSMGIPSPVTTWHLPNGEVIVPSTNHPSYLLHPNGSLTIFSVKCDKDHGHFRCLCENEAGSDSIDISVTVQCKPRVLQRPANIEIAEGGSSSVSCEVIGRPEPQLLWYRYNSGIPLVSGPVYNVLGDNSLVFRVMRENMIGQYNCTAVNQLGVAGHTFYVHMLYKPRFTIQNLYSSSRVGDSALLECHFHAYPTPTVYWSKDGHQITEDSGMQVMPNNSLHIAAVYPHHYGEYECVLTNSIGSESASVFLTSVDEIYWTLKPKATAVAEDQDVELHCVVAGPPQPLYSWYFQPSLSSPTQLLSFSATESLHITNVKLDDSGVYTCEVTYNNNTVSASVFLNVTKNVQSIHKETVEEGSSTTLYAPLNSQATQTVTWYSPDEIETGNGLSLYIAEVQIEAHWGLWVIRACNATSCSRVFMFLEVQGKPVISKYQIAGNESYISIECNTKGSPTPDVLYYQSYSLISSSVVVPGHFIQTGEESKTLVISRRMQRDTYTCVAGNKYGQQRLKLSKPDQIEAIAESITPTSVTITWANEEASVTVTPPLIGYKLTHTTANSQEEVQLSPTSHSYTFLELAAYSLHTVTISSFNELGSSKNAVLGVRTSAAAPGSPRHLDVYIQDGCLYISWTPPQPLNGRPEDIQYELTVQVTVGEQFTLTTNETSEQFYPSTSAMVRVSVLAYNNESFYAEKESETTSKSLSFASTDVTILAISPANIRAVLSAVETIEVTWEAIFGISVYTVHYERVGWQKSVTINRTSHVLLNVLSGFIYNIKVAGGNSAGVGVYSDVIVITVPTTGDNSQPSSHRTPNLDLSSILAIIFGVLLVAVVGFIFSLLLIYRRNRKRKLDEASLNEGFKPSRVLGDYRTGNAVDNSSNNSNTEISEVEDKSERRSGRAARESGIRERKEFKVILTGEERSVDVVEEQPELANASSINIYGARDDLAAAVEMLRTEIQQDVPSQKTNQFDGKESRRFLKVSEFDPRIQKLSASGSSNVDTAGTMSRRRPLNEAEIY